jgi:hypothetical protein
MEHLFNCHGEWAAIMAALTSLPFIKTWFTARGGCKANNRKANASLRRVRASLDAFEGENK